MIIRSFLLAGAVALRANAFLIVPEVQGNSIAPEADVVPLDPVQILDTKQQQITLRCTECPFRDVREDGTVSWSDGFETSLSFNFSVEGGVLLANGDQIFPPPPVRVNAVQRRELDGKESEPIPLGHLLEVMPQATPSEEPVIELSTVRFTVLDLDGHPIPVNTIAIVLIRDPAGELFIVNTGIEETTPNRLSWRQCRGRPRCLRKLLFSRIRALIAAAKTRMLEMGSKVSGFKGCHGGPTLPINEPEHGRFSFPAPPAHSDDEQPSVWKGTHHGHARPHHRAGWERTFSRVVRFVVVPAALGVLAGLAASALGMLVGQAIVFLWLRYRRSGPEQSAVQMEQGTDSEKQALMTDDLPPQYEEDNKN